MCVCVCGYWDGKTGTLIFDGLLIVFGGCFGGPVRCDGMGEKCQDGSSKGKVSVSVLASSPLPLSAASSRAASSPVRTPSPAETLPGLVCP